MMNILVTGAGALLGQGILRCLRLSTKPYRIITADPNPGSSGHWLGDKAYLIPMANSNAYISALEEIIMAEQIHVVLVGTDVELPQLALHKTAIETKTAAKIIISSPAVINIANDKWLTAEFLRKSGFPYPASALTTDKMAIRKLQAEFGFPLIAKPVDGARSIGFEIIKEEERLKYLMSYPNNLVVQEYLDDEIGEYTSGCVVYNGECKSIVTLQRDLRDGNTYRTYRDGKTNQYDQIIKDIATKLNVEGPCNFQFRIKNGQPIIFEINARFSGTTPLRSFYGFNEVDAIIDYVINNKEIIQEPLKEGIILRAYSDIMFSNEDYYQLKSDAVLPKPRCEQYSFIL